MKRVLVIALVVGWFGAALAANALLWRYKGEPGEAALAAPTTWPQASTLSRTEGAATLVMFAHPACPCTAAAISELERLMAKTRGKLAARVIILDVEGASDGWRSSAAGRSGRIPGVTVSFDEGGVEAQRFGAKTSGQTYLYGADGALAFRGGLTAARGHEGENEGSDAIFRHVMAQAGGQTDTAVYGCALQDPLAAVDGERSGGR